MILDARITNILVNAGLVVSDDTAAPLVIDGPLEHSRKIGGERQVLPCRIRSQTPTARRTRSTVHL